MTSAPKKNLLQCSEGTQDEKSFFIRPVKPYSCMNSKFGNEQIAYSLINKHTIQKKISVSSPSNFSRCALLSERRAAVLLRLYFAGNHTTGNESVVLPTIPSWQVLRSRTEYVPNYSCMISHAHRSGAQKSFVIWRCSAL